MENLLTVTVVAVDLMSMLKVWSYRAAPEEPLRIKATVGGRTIVDTGALTAVLIGTLAQAAIMGDPNDPELADAMVNASDAMTRGDEQP